MAFSRKILSALFFALYSLSLEGHDAPSIRLDSAEGTAWTMCRRSEVSEDGSALSRSGYRNDTWLPARVPGTVLGSLVAADVYPDPYFGTVNRISDGVIPDIADAGREFYTYWFRAEFDVPESFRGHTAWLAPEGINYRAEIWLNGFLVEVTAGMFRRYKLDVTDRIIPGKKNAIAILVFPVDNPGRAQRKPWGAPGENRNGGDGQIGRNVSQLMTVGWDFTFNDGIRDRNTGIWKSIRLFTTGEVSLDAPFVKSVLNHPGYDCAKETISVEVHNPAAGYSDPVRCTVEGRIEGTGISFAKDITLLRGERRTLTFTPEEFPELILDHPKLWWPKNKGEQHLYTLTLKALVDGHLSDSLQTDFGIREILVSRETPDSSKLFLVNGRKLFIRGSNWIPEAMLRTDDARMETELSYTDQSGINLLRLWGGGIAESDRFYELCDRYGILVWQEFWMTGDTRHPSDEALYRANLESTVKRIRNHPSVAIYVSSNESTEVGGVSEWLDELDGTRPYQMQSECDGVHDGSPYKQVNPMQHYENTASDRGSRVDGFNPEYGAPSLPIVDDLRRMMPEDRLWPIDKATWDYLDGGGFHLMTGLFTDMVNAYGAATDIADYTRKGQLVAAMNAKSIWEVWNYNRLDSGDRFCSGLLFWYHNCPNVQVCARMWDWYLEPTAALYHTARALEPLHIQFDYLKNTVSVTNDLPQAFTGLSATARVYDLSSRKRWEKTVPAQVGPESTACDILTVLFPEGLSPVHFISLELKDAAGRMVSENFYWRSDDPYQGPGTVTGPTTGGFETLSGMPGAVLKCTTETQPDGSVRIIIKNTSSRIAFFNQLLVLDGDGLPLHQILYSDNFFTLLPGRSKTVLLKAQEGDTLLGKTLRFGGWNTPERTIKLR